MIGIPAKMRPTAKSTNPPWLKKSLIFFIITPY
jgi:hypothetical protein